MMRHRLSHATQDVTQWHESPDLATNHGDVFAPSRLTLAILTIAFSVWANPFSGTQARAEPVPATACCDIVIRGGLVVDGTRNLPRRADIGIKDGKIIFVGKVSAKSSAHEIDASGMVVAPGFIDAHNHAEESIFENPAYRKNENFLLQGVTTIVGSPDGFKSPSEVRGYLAAMKKNGLGTNYSFYVGHNGVRREGMGMAQRAPTAEELDRMRALVREGMEMGALGLSTGLMYEPGMFSTTDEVVELTKIVKPYDGIYDSHTRDPAMHMLASEAEAIEIGRRAGNVPVKLGHLKAVGLRNADRISDVIRIVHEARNSGHDVVADQYPYDGAATAFLHEVIVLPGKQADPFSAKSLATVQSALRDEAALLDIQDATEHGIMGGFAWLRYVGYDALRIVNNPNNPKNNGKYLVDLAKDRGMLPFAALRALILESPQPILVTLGAIKEADVRALMVQPWVMIASDGEYVAPDAKAGGGHPRSTGTFPRILGHYVREVGLLDLADSVRRMTCFPAEFLRLRDRGRLAPGYVADIVIFNPNEISDQSNWTEPHRYSVGMKYVLVNGQIAVRDGRVTGVTAGRPALRQTMPPKGAQPESCS
jgi:N-acyl-D-amino-acid deacylase